MRNLIILFAVAAVTAVILGTPLARAAIMPDPYVQQDLESVLADPPSVEGFPYQDLLATAAGKYGLSLPYVLAVARGESFFDPNAVSSKGAIGLMQVMPETAADYGIASSDLSDPAVNVDVGVHYLADLYTRLEDPYLALAAYYCGPGGVDRESFTLREDCNEYVRYIHSHLRKILARANAPTTEKSRRERYVVLTLFDNILDAEQFVAMLTESLPDLRFDMLRSESQREDHARLQYRIVASDGKGSSPAAICSAVQGATGFIFCTP